MEHVVFVSFGWLIRDILVGKNGCRLVDDLPCKLDGGKLVFCEEDYGQT